jgi:hypothetical protein
VENFVPPSLTLIIEMMKTKAATEVKGFAQNPDQFTYRRIREDPLDTWESAYPSCFSFSL